MVEAAPAAALVVPEPDFLLEILVSCSMRQRSSAKSTQIGEAGLLGQGRQPVLRRLRLALGPCCAPVQIRAITADPSSIAACDAVVRMTPQREQRASGLDHDGAMPTRPASRSNN